MTALEPVSDDAAARPARRPTIDLTAPPAGPRSAGAAALLPALPPTNRPAVRSAPHEADENDAHLLRLCLDLQLDAMLLALGAAAAQEVRADVAAPAAVPWRRWVEEDVDLAATLAADAMSGRATLPSTLGTELDHDVPATVVDNLVARYESMRDLLTDLLGRDTASDGDRWRPRVRDALHRCQARLVELRGHRLGATPPRGVRLPAMSGSPLAPEHEYLPGELLG